MLLIISVSEKIGIRIDIIRARCKISLLASDRPKNLLDTSIVSTHMVWMDRYYYIRVCYTNHYVLLSFYKPIVVSRNVSFVYRYICF